MMVTIDHHAVDVSFTRKAVCIELADGRTICAPLEWFPALEAATPARREFWTLVANGHAVEWAKLGERITMPFLLSLKAGWSVASDSAQAQRAML